MLPDVQYPINTYGWLKKAVSLWADRDDDEFVNQIPNFINFAEKEIYRNLRIPPLEKEIYLGIENGVAVLPVDYLETQWIMRAGNGQLLRVTSPEEIDWLKRNKTTHPSQFNEGEITFARMGKRLFFYPAINASVPRYPDDGSPIEPTPDAIIMNYYADPKEFWEDTDTSAVLTIAPELLLYFALRHASLFVQDDNAVQKWSALGKAILDEIVTQHDKAEYSGSPLAIPNTIETMTSSKTNFGIKYSL